MDKRCFFIVGPEGSGTYMMAEAFGKAGCEYVSEEEHFSNFLKSLGDKDIVIRRSIPHRGEFIDLYTIAGVAQMAGYEVRAISILRQPYATYRSVSARREITKPDVYENMLGAMTCIAELGSGFPVLPITYEAVVNNPAFRYWLFVTELDLKYPDYEFYDGNAKYYL